MRWKERLSSITVQLRGMFVLIIFFLLLMQFLMFSWTRYAVTNELHTTAKSHVVYLRDTMRDHVINIYSSAHQLLLDQTITDYSLTYSRLDNYEKTICLNNIISLLQKARFNHPLIGEIRLFLCEENRVFSSNGFTYLMDRSEIDPILREAVSQGRFTTQRDDTLVVWTSQPLLLNKAENFSPRLYLEVILDQETLQSHLSSFNSYSDKIAWLFSHATDKLLTSKNSLLSGQAIQEIRKAPLDEIPSVLELRIGNIDYFAVVCYSNLLKCSFGQLIPASVIKTIPSRFQFFTLVITGCGLAGYVVYTLFLRKKLVRPLNELTSAYECVGGGDLGVRVEKFSTIEFDRLSSHFNRMLERLNQQILINYEQKMLIQRAELKQLQAQIHPHFLYNSFFMVRHMVQSGNIAQADQALDHMGCYFKYIARNGQDVVCLEEEYSHAMDYLAIQSMRFGERVACDITPLPGRLAHQKVPRLILQPLFENIFKHCLPLAEHKICISLHFEERKDGYSIFVEDNGHSLSPEQIDHLEDQFTLRPPLEETTGLMNVHKRLQLIWGNSCGLHASQSRMGGLKLEVRLTYKEDPL